MDADAYLKRHGWKGAGHALDNHGRGIKKPLLIAHKQDQLGLGQKKAAHRTDDQWWMRAFDESLKNIGTGQEVRSHLTEDWGNCYKFAKY
jgi:nucleolar protein TMA23